MQANFDPSTISGALVWGIAAGVATSALLFVATVLVRKALIPAYQAIVYEGVDLAGTWVHDKNLSGIRYDYVVTLTQHAHLLRGNMVLKKTGAAPGLWGDYVQVFKVSGSTWEGYVTLNMKSEDHKSLSFATALFQIQNRGATLDGQLAYRSAQLGTVGAEAITLTRQ